MLIVASGCGDDAPEAEELPLAPGLEIATSAVRTSNVDSTRQYLALVLTSSTSASSAAIHEAQVAYLRAQGWRVERHENGTVNLDAPDDSLFAFLGRSGGDCGGLAEEIRAERDTPYLCATLGGAS